MLCTKCNSREANFHYKQIIGGKKAEQHLCSQCAHELGYFGQNESVFDIGSLLNAFISIPMAHGSSKSAVSCEGCNTTYDEFRRTGLLGCDKCYETFGSIIESTLSQIQPSTVHKGSLSGEEGAKIRKENELSTLKDELKKAIIDERYEDAAVLRDKIKRMEEKDNG